MINKNRNIRINSISSNLSFGYLLTLLLFIIALKRLGQIWTYECPSGEKYKSPSYEVNIIQGNDILKSFVHYSYCKDEYIFYDTRLEHTEPKDNNHNEPERFLFTIISFSHSVIVRIKIKNGANNIILPPKFAKILPSSYNIPCVIKHGNIIEFKMDRPEKIVVIPNRYYDLIKDKELFYLKFVKNNKKA